MKELGPVGGCTGMPPRSAYDQDLQFITQKALDTKPKPNPIKLPQWSHQDHLQPTQSVKPVLGFTPQEYQEVQDNPKINVKDLPQIEPCTDYVKTPLQTLARIHVNQPEIPTSS